MEGKLGNHDLIILQHVYGLNKKFGKLWKTLRLLSKL